MTTIQAGAAARSLLGSRTRLDPLRNRRAFAGRLLRWYGSERRDLPWRRSATPYRILVSEMMLQQTRVETVIPHFRRFLRRFPSFTALARADEQTVLAAWEGLGYYRRARHLLSTARAAAARGGRLPSTAAELALLPGIGPYTAAAIASIAFGRAEPVLDGNVERVLARLFALDRPPAERRRALRERLRAIVPAVAPGDFAQALMDLGAGVCTPRRPACRTCPVRSFCRALALGDVEGFPRRRPRRPVPVRTEQAVLLRRRGRLLLRRRGNGLLGGLWGFPSYPAAPGDPARTLARFRRDTGLRVRCEESLSPLRHDYSHVRLVLTPLVCVADGSPPRTGARPYGLPPGYGWFSRVSTSALPLGKVDRLALASLEKVSV